MGALWIRTLGPLQVVADGAPVGMGSGKLRIVLACLALRANSVVGTDFLAEAVWDGHPPAQPGPQLQVYVANLRRLLDPHRSKRVASQRLASRPGGYVLIATADELDLLQFREHVAAGELAVQAGNLEGGADSLRQAVELFQGPAFPDLADVELLGPDLDGLDEARLDAYQDLFDVELALGRHSALMGELQRLVQEHPYRERLWAALVLALYRSDRQADALAACREARRIFAADLGIDPGARLRELETLVLRQDASLAAPAADGHRRIRPRLDNLPAELTPLVGRDAELGEVCSLYRSEGCRLVTVTGPGGTGKTRLALAAAAELGERMADGVSWVNLAPLTRSQQVAGAIAATLGLEDWGTEDPLKIASRFLRTRRLLLVLDNFEHLEEAWPVVLDMLTAAPDLRILTTSRRRLGLRAEYEYGLAPLALPPLDPPLPPRRLREVPAVKLFVTRGRAVRPHFDVDSGNAAVITRLCHRLDGLPLAIELAAAQLRNISEASLLDDLELSLASLPEAFRDLPDRQRTLTATIAWSYELLGQDERLLFDQLGVFAADPTVAAVGAICGRMAGAPPDSDGVQPEALLSALARHSLLRRYSDRPGSSRVSMLHSIREFTRDRLCLLEDPAAVRRRHAQYYLGLAERLGPQLWGHGQLEAFRLLHADAPDLRAALLWAAGPGGATDVALQLVGQLWHYWELTGDVAEQCGTAVSLLDGIRDAAPALLAPALSGTATLCWTVGRYDQAAGLHRRALHAFGQAGNNRGAAWTTMCLAVQAAQSDEIGTAERLASEALLMTGASHRTRVAALIVLSRLAFYAGDHARALDLSKECADLTRPLGDRWLLGNTLVNLAESREQAGDYDAAEHLLYEALGALLELGANGNIVAILESIAGVYAAQHRVERAIRLLGTTDAYRMDRGLPLYPAEQRRVDSVITRARTEAGLIRFGIAWAAGKAITLTQAANEVLRGRNGRSRTVHEAGQSRNSAPISPESVLDPAPW
ncbi:BTAD domain-containing putative transcriptional regulator [Arthrobacter sp. BE255]|uniref:AfsR/SARP family transcriptional regulator n=1 Tax=Arthrobacter sp. BE255 TaxID=2817721 RepID=UPI002860A582|nr:BTAD domain-containing putative transcriptional regulator [Arthrobacter sp. BE255]MDR7161302.1 putative ATPase/DNA-binding SARP family transcriptional activator [Arthrobacter sp. BE255]